MQHVCLGCTSSGQGTKDKELKWLPLYPVQAAESHSKVYLLWGYYILHQPNMQPHVSGSSPGEGIGSAAVLVTSWVQTTHLHSPFLLPILLPSYPSSTVESHHATWWWTYHYWHPVLFPLVPCRNALLQVTAHALVAWLYWQGMI